MSYGDIVVCLGLVWDLFLQPVIIKKSAKESPLCLALLFSLSPPPFSCFSVFHLLSLYVDGKQGEQASSLDSFTHAHTCTPTPPHTQDKQGRGAATCKDLVLLFLVPLLWQFVWGNIYSLLLSHVVLLQTLMVKLLLRSLYISQSLSHSLDFLHTKKGSNPSLPPHSSNHWQSIAVLSMFTITTTRPHTDYIHAIYI